MSVVDTILAGVGFFVAITLGIIGLVFVDTGFRRPDWFCVVVGVWGWVTAVVVFWAALGVVYGSAP